MEYQPDEIIVEQLLRTPVPNILNFCQSNQRIARICQSSNLWIGLLRRDYPHVPWSLQTLNGRSFRQLYFDIVPVRLYYNHNFVSSFPMDSMNPRPDQIVLQTISSLTSKPWIAFYQNEQGNIAGYQTALGLDPWLVRQVFNSTRNVWIYDSDYPPISPFLTISGLVRLADFEIQNPGPTRAELGTALRDIDLTINDLGRWGYFGTGPARYPFA